MSALLAIALLGETAHLAARIACIGAVFAGTMLMVERDGDGPRVAVPGARDGRSWLAYAVLSAVFAAATSVLAKVGVQGVDSNLATALRTCVVLVLAWGIVIARGKVGRLMGIGRREFSFLVLSGIATGASWLLYYGAIKMGQVSVVVQVDKLSILVSIAFARIALGERLGRRAAAGLVLMVAATLVMTALAG